MQFLYRLGAVVFGTVIFLIVYALGVLYWLTHDPQASKHLEQLSARTNSLEPVVWYVLTTSLVIIAPIGALVAWIVIRTWRWICGQNNRVTPANPMSVAAVRSYARSADELLPLTREEIVRVDRIIDKATGQRSPTNVVSPKDLAWLEQRIGGLAEGAQLIDLIRQLNMSNTLKPKDVANFVQKYGTESYHRPPIIPRWRNGAVISRWRLR